MGLLSVCHKVAPDIWLRDAAAQTLYAKEVGFAAILRSRNTNLLVLLSIDGNLTLLFACSWFHF